LGATAQLVNVDDGDNMKPEDLPRGVRLMGNLTKDFPLNEFVMMMNNYNNVKEFDVSYLNITELYWYALNAIKEPFPPIRNTMDLVVELELLLLTKEE
jgi:hypothetical protein